MAKVVPRVLRGHTSPNVACPPLCPTCLRPSCCTSPALRVLSPCPCLPCRCVLSSREGVLLRRLWLLLWPHGTYQVGRLVVHSFARSTGPVRYRPVLQASDHKRHCTVQSTYGEDTAALMCHCGTAPHVRWLQLYLVQPTLQ